MKKIYIKNIDSTYKESAGESPVPRRLKAPFWYSLNSILENYKEKKMCRLVDYIRFRDWWQFVDFTYDDDISIMLTLCYGDEIIFFYINNEK